MTREEAIKALQEIHQDESWDIEAAHDIADDVLCDLLISLGYEDVVKEWEEVPKWYA